MSMQDDELTDARPAAAALTSPESRRAPAAWLVLVLVIEQPSHGYEIHRRYEQRFGGLLPVSMARLYPILGQLHKAGMIEPIRLEPLDQPRKQHGLRRSYRATPAGVQALRCWVSERMRDDMERPQVLGRIASTGVLGLDAVRALVDRYEHDCMEAMRVLPLSDPKDVHGGIPELVESLVADQQRREMRARIDWAVHARGILRAYSERSTVKEEDE